MADVACHPRIVQRLACSQTARKSETPFEKFSRAAVASVDAFLGQVRYSLDGRSRPCEATVARDFGHDG